MILCPICNCKAYFLTQKKDRFGQKYHYVRCQSCRFLFENDLVCNQGLLVKKVTKVYQKDYFESIDIGWKNRADNFLNFFRLFLGLYKFFSFKKKLSILDYGGGNGYIASKLGDFGNVLYYDKYDKPIIGGEYETLESPKKASVIYAVELVEHLTDINEWDFLVELSPNIFVFTTCLTNNIKEKDLVQWAYFNPDAGHVAIYHSQSLYLLGKKYGFVYLFLPNISTHIFFKNRFLSQFNFVKVEYVIYKLFRKIKNILK